jgi:hypothetical protein
MNRRIDGSMKVQGPLRRSKMAGQFHALAKRVMYCAEHSFADPIARSFANGVMKRQVRLRGIGAHRSEGGTHGGKILARGTLGSASCEFRLDHQTSLKHLRERDAIQ